jgi:hypothetical protein
MSPPEKVAFRSSYELFDLGDKLPEAERLDDIP